MKYYSLLETLMGLSKRVRKQCRRTASLQQCYTLCKHCQDTRYRAGTRRLVSNLSELCVIIRNSLPRYDMLEPLSRPRKSISASMKCQLDNNYTANTIP